MKRFGYWFGESPSGEHHLIAPTPDSAGIVAVPQDRITAFRKLPWAQKGEHPRRCVFEVETWLGMKTDYQAFREAKFGVDYA